MEIRNPVVVNRRCRTFWRGRRIIKSGYGQTSGILRQAGRSVLRARPSKQNELRGGLATYTRRGRRLCAVAWQIMDQWQLPWRAAPRSDGPITNHKKANFSSIPPSAPLHPGLYRATIAHVPVLPLGQPAGVWECRITWRLAACRRSELPSFIAVLKFIFPFHSCPPAFSIPSTPCLGRLASSHRKSYQRCQPRTTKTRHETHLATGWTRTMQRPLSQQALEGASWLRIGLAQLSRVLAPRQVRAFISFLLARLVGNSANRAGPLQLRLLLRPSLPLKHFTNPYFGARPSGPEPVQNILVFLLPLPSPLPSSLLLARSFPTTKSSATDRHGSYRVMLPRFDSIHLLTSLLCYQTPGLGFEFAPSRLARSEV